MEKLRVGDKVTLSSGYSCGEGTVGIVKEVGITGFGPSVVKVSFSEHSSLLAWESDCTLHTETVLNSSLEGAVL